MYYVYILKCQDNSFYTGSTNNWQKRLACHNKGEAAKYTRGRLPVRIIYLEECSDKSAALKREAAIKKLSRPQKEQLIANATNLPT